MPFKDISLRKKVYLFTASLMIVSVINYFTLIWLEDKSVRYFNYVDETHEIIELTNDFLGAMVDAETGQRGFILTGNHTYLEPFDRGSLMSQSLMEK